MKYSNYQCNVIKRGCRVSTKRMQLRVVSNVSRWGKKVSVKVEILNGQDK